MKIDVSKLPSPQTRRWVIRKKATVVLAVRQGLITLDKAMKDYNLSIDEYISWELSYENNGPQGLRVTRLQQYRRA